MLVSIHLSFFFFRQFRRKNYEYQLSFSGKDSAADFFVFGHFDQNTKNGMNRTISYNRAKAGVQKVYKPTILRHIPSFRLLTQQFLVIHMYHLFIKMQVWVCTLYCEFLISFWIATVAIIADLSVLHINAQWSI